MSVPPLRIHRKNEAPVNAAGEYVLYWMIAHRRLRWNFALDRALSRARGLGKPLLIFEALRADYRWASDRLHGFVLDGMAEHAAALAGTAIGYYPYVERAPGEGKGLLAALAARACQVVTDEFPSFFLPRMVGSAARELPVVLEAVDSNGLFPLAAADRTFGRAVDFRRFLQRHLITHLAAAPRAAPLADLELPPCPPLPAAITARWPAATAAELARPRELCAQLPIDHGVAPVDVRGGEAPARAALGRFIATRLAKYGERNQPAAEATSGLSPYLHFGHTSAHEIFYEVTRHEGWTPSRVSDEASGAKEGFWGMSAAAEGFLDQLITWRELGFNQSSREADCECYESLPAWAQQTLAEHASDPRAALYTLPEFAAAATHDEVWNAAQRELLTTGTIHNYLRMVWGKMILAWSATPEEALTTMLELNNKYALDGRNPNSSSGIFWCLGRYDRPWAPARPVFGVVRCMTTASTRRKLNLEGYLRRFGAQRSLL